MGKNFKGNIKGADKLFSVNDTRSTDGTSDINNTSNTDNTLEKKEYYRINLRLDKELKEYISEAAWRERMTITDYINTLIRGDRDKKQT